MKVREYAGPLTVLVAGILGFSLFCIVSAAALADPRLPNASSALEPRNIVDSAINNINTMAALTMQAVAQYIPTATPSPSDTSVATLTVALPTATPTIIPSATRILPSPTRQPYIPFPTRTRTPVPTRTYTPLPNPTDTLPPTPTPTDTPVPTNTPVPPTETPVPPPTDTPFPTETPIEGTPIQIAVP